MPLTFEDAKRVPVGALSTSFTRLRQKQSCHVAGWVSRRAHKRIQGSLPVASRNGDGRDVDEINPRLSHRLGIRVNRPNAVEIVVRNHDEDPVRT